MSKVASPNTFQLITLFPWHLFHDYNFYFSTCLLSFLPSKRKFHEGKVPRHNTKKPLRYFLNEWINRWLLHFKLIIEFNFFPECDLMKEKELCFKIDLKRASTMEGQGVMCYCAHYSFVIDFILIYNWGRLFF